VDKAKKQVRAYDAAGLLLAAYPATVGSADMPTRTFLLADLAGALTSLAMLMGAIFADAMGRDMMPDVYPQPAAKAGEMYTGLLLRAIGVENGSAKATTKQTKRTKQLSI